MLVASSRCHSRPDLRVRCTCVRDRGGWLKDEKGRKKGFTRSRGYQIGMSTWIPSFKSSVVVDTEPDAHSLLEELRHVRVPSGRGWTPPWPQGSSFALKKSSRAVGAHDGVGPDCACGGRAAYESMNVLSSKYAAGKLSRGQRIEYATEGPF